MNWRDRFRLSTEVLLLSMSVRILTSAQGLFAVWTEGEERSRSYDVLHYRIEVEFDESQKSVIGAVRTTLVPLLPRLDSLDFDAEGLDVHRVTKGDGTPLRFSVLPKVLRIWLDRPYSFHDTLTVSTAYTAVPGKGLYFIQPDSLAPEKPWQIWTQGQAEENHFWFPCYDFPNDKATSEVLATVRDEYTLLSNGALVSVRENSANRTKTFHWRESKPHASYLIMLAAGVYDIIQDRYDSIPVLSYVYPSRREDGERVFHGAADMLKFFSELIGYRYPWEKYAQIPIADFMWGGMENTSATTFNDTYVVIDRRAELDRSSRGFVAHELAHQWWGDLVTCKNWKHLWLNEGFAEYFEDLQERHQLGEDEFAYTQYRHQQAAINSDKRTGRKPIVSVDSPQPNLYGRGASVLHMLRYVLGDELFWRAINHYAHAYEFQSVETNDFKLAIEQSTGQNLYWFFDEWLYKAGYPVFDIASRWDEDAQKLTLSVKQVQKRDSLTGLFRMPVDIEVTTESGAETHRVLLANQEEEFAFPLNSKPLLVIFDKGNWILKEVHFPKTREELIRQLQPNQDIEARLTALDQLHSDSLWSSDGGLFSIFSDVALSDSFWAVRAGAVNAVGTMDVAGVEDVLLEAYQDTDSRVRNAAVTNLGRFPTQRVKDLLRKAVDGDSSYVVNASALRVLATVDPANSLDLAAAHLGTPSFLDGISRAAVSVLSSIDDRRSIPHLIEYSKIGHQTFTRYAALAGLKRYVGENRDVQECLLALLNDPDKAIRIRAIRMLGSIGGDAVTQALRDRQAQETDHEVLDEIENQLKREKSASEVGGR